MLQTIDSLEFDGYIRVSHVDFRHYSFSHLMSGLDEEDILPGHGATSTQITGYTEWLCSQNPQISLGWDWQLLANNQLEIIRISPPHTNLMLVDERQKDLGIKRSLLIITALIDELPWQQVLREHLEL